MKTKLNLTIDEELIPRSRIFARKQGKSISQIVEELLRKHISKEEKTFSEKWKGSLSLKYKDDERFKKLKERYQL